MDVACRHCGTEMTEWPDLFTQFFETNQEPIHPCATCGARTPITQLDYIPGAGFGYFMMTFSEAYGDPRTDSVIWTEMERILGTGLRHASYSL
jgi:hypothetical protein